MEALFHEQHAADRGQGFAHCRPTNQRPTYQEPCIWHAHRSSSGLRPAQPGQVAQAVDLSQASQPIHVRIGIGRKFQHQPYQVDLGDAGKKILKRTLGVEALWHFAA